MLLSAHFYGLPLLSRYLHSSRQINRGVVIHGTILIAGFSDRVSNAGYPQTVQSNHKVHAVPARPCPGRVPPGITRKNLFWGCYPAHIFKTSKILSHFFLCSNSFTKIFFLQIVLSITTAHPCCYSQHNFNLPARNPQNLAPPAWVVIQRTFCGNVSILYPNRVVIPCILLF